MLRRLFLVVVPVLAVGTVAAALVLPDGAATRRQADDAKRDIAVLEELRPLAAKGDARAQYALAFMYLRGKGVQRDDTTALTLLREAAEQGHTRAQYSLAILYHVGLGVRQSDAAAVAWFRRAAEQGHTKARDTLAVMYARGDAIPNDDAEAVKLSRLAAARDPVATPAPSHPEIAKPLAAATSEKPAPETSIQTPPVPANGAFRIQLGAVKVKARAVAEAGRLNRIHGPVLGGLKVVPVRASLGTRGVFYRLRAGPLDDRASADSLCRKLVALRQSCLVARR